VSKKPKRHKSEHRLNPNHGWRSKPGNNVIVLDRGAVRFDVPNTWVVSEVPDPGGAHFTMFDKPEPDDDLRFQVSVYHLNPEIDWSGIPIDTVLTQALSGLEDSDGRRTISQSEPVLIKRPGLVLAWNETLFVDPKDDREAYTRALLAHGSLIQTLMTMDFWVDDAGWAVPAWDEILRSLRLGQYVKDPLQGPPVYH
jgi:hypothetical protein